MEYENIAPNSPDRRIGWLWTLIAALIAAGIGFYFYRMILVNPCGVPITYSVGDIDSRFKIPPMEIRSVIDDAAGRWNSDLGQTVYRYDPSAKLKINLVYDQRQQKLDATKAAITEFDQTSQTINEFRAKVEQLSTAYEKDLNAYNQRVAYWNARGGAPAETYDQLNSERLALDKRRLELNKMGNLLNAQINENNGNIADFNSQIEKDRDKIVTSGEYFTDGSKINIYTYGDKQELRLVLMHELGHAISYEHDNQPASILYPMLQDQDITNPEPSEEDKTLVDSICGFGRQPLDWKTLIYRIRVRFIKLSAQQQN